MKKALLIVLMALMLVIPAYAAEGDPATDHPIQQEQEPIVVATLEELQAAIEAAVALGWIEDNANFIPDAVIGRGELAQLINNVLVLYR